MSAKYYLMPCEHTAAPSTAAPLSTKKAMPSSGSNAKGYRTCHFGAVVN